jgi:DNA-binding LytR/AlgR family response regulator
MQARPGAGVRHQIEPDSVIAITADGNYSYIHMINGERLYVSRTLSWFTQRWPALLRIHKHALINPGFINQYQLKMGKRPIGHVVMKTNLRLEVSRRRIREVETYLGHQS